MKTVIPTPSSIRETFILSNPYVHKCKTCGSLALPNIVCWTPTWPAWGQPGLDSPPTCVRCSHDVPYVVKVILRGRNAIHYVSMKWLLGEGVLPMHCTMHTAHRTQETGHCHRQVIIALLVTDPPDANLNNLQNPPIGQTTTFKIHCQG